MALKKRDDEIENLKLQPSEVKKRYVRPTFRIVLIGPLRTPVIQTFHT